MGKWINAALLASIIISGSITTATGQTKVTTLRCEYQKNPIGIDVMLPRLSWQLQSNQRGVKQSSYQIVAADSEREITMHHGSLWDSGKIDSDVTTQIPYQGKPLKTGERVLWSVRSWDQSGKPTSWSAPAYFEMGMLNPGDWKARWIGASTQNKTVAESISDMRWIWYPEGNPAKSAPEGDRYFRLSLELPAGKKVQKATLSAIVDNSFTAGVNGKPVGEGSGWQSLQEMDIASELVPGANAIAIKAHNTDGPAGLAALVKISFTDGTSQRYVTGASWKSSQTASAGWNLARFAETGWRPALVIANLGDAPWGQIAAAQPPPSPVPYLRRSFLLDKPIRQARIYATSLGLYKLSINGKPVSRDMFTPGWTDYNKRVQYQTYDVTTSLKQGDNALGIILGDGWYSGYVGFGRRRDHYGTTPYALAQLVVTYDDGRTETIETDDSWKSSTGPIETSDMLMGENYDARKEATGWDTPQFDASAWKSVNSMPVISQTTQHLRQPTIPISSPTPLLVASCSPAVQEVKTIRAKSIVEKPAGSYVFDLGQNMVGWARLKVRGPAGKTVTLRFAEILNKDGTVYTTNLRSARATDHYTLKGGGEEIYEPSFTFHGFRYVEVTGYPGKPGLDALTGIVAHSATPETATFECSNPMVNKLQQNIVWGMRGNYFDVPTDCPQRDERLGWMGDAQIFVRTGCYNMDISAFMTKWMQDVEDAQSPEGGFSDVSPRLVDPSDGAPAWGDAGVIVPFTIWQCYGDTRIIEKRYSAMAKWIEYIHSVNPDLIWRKHSNNNFGDWLSINADTPRDVLATAYFAYDASLMAKMAKAIDKTDDAQMYSELYENIKTAFNKTFVSADGRIKGDTQTCYVLALRFGLLPDSLRPVAAKYLTDDIAKRGNHLSTGFVGVGYLTPTLTKNGYLDVAYKLLNQDTFPSWGYSIKQGATTIWERWDGYTAEKGFQDPGMNSFNHYSLGSVGEWMYTDVGGIDLDPAQPGYKHILMHPRPGGAMTYAKTSYESIHGMINSDWKLESGKFTYKITVPANTTATVWIPTKDAVSIRESGNTIEKTNGVVLLRMEDGCAVYEVGSGTYQFETSSS